MFESFGFGKKKDEEKVSQGKVGNEESVEVSKLEWSPEFGEISCDEARKKIEELNASLAEGENKWRFPDEFDLRKKFKLPGADGLKTDKYYWFIKEDNDTEWAGLDSSGKYNYIISANNSLRFIRGSNN